jgi:serine/threonine protein phosphatase PrpC
MGQVGRPEIVAATDVGLQRSNNEDAFAVVDAVGLCVVADGMGGHLGGEVAASIVIRVLEEEFANHPLNGEPPPEIATRLAEAVKRANLEIYTRGCADTRLRNMGTTVVAALLHQGQLVFASVGDSRIYRLRDSKIEQLTEDHSWVGELRKRNLISSEDARHHPLRNIITRALGMEDSVAVDTSVVPVKPGDIYILCTDGLTDLVEDAAIARIAQQDLDDLQAVITRLVSAANALGGIDNITVGLYRVPE